MKKNLILFVSTLAFVLTTSAAFGFGSFGDSVNNYCSNTPYINNDCALCHSDSAAKNAYKDGNLDYFCPPVDPNTVDDDNDGYTENQGDCNDTNASINPGAEEICGDGIDQDCSGADLACPVDPNTVDDDADGYTENQGDCNDTNASINPGAEEICGDGIDQDCSGADLACPVDPNTVDDDADGYTENQGDCNDTNASINPGAEEICGDGIDQDCSGADLACPVDPNTVDDDADGYTENQGDCNDADAGINPGAEDICGDGIDQDCSGADAVCAPTEPTEPACTDADNDGYSVEGGECGPVDCNDEAPATNPGAAERCGDGIDNNCDGLTDGQDTQACPAPPTCTDADADGFFAEADCNTVQDCNDDDNLTFPGATELCGDAIDNDCDGSVDEGCDVVDTLNGAALYDNYCATCHNSVENSDVRNEDADEIMEAIEENEGGMSSLSSLTDDQIKLIADELAGSSSDDGHDSDDDGGDHSNDDRKDHGKKLGWEKGSRHDD